MAALELAKRGTSVAVLDWRTNIGDKLCTGIIGRECAELVPPAPEHIHGEARSATVVSPEGRRYHIERSATQAYVVDRAAYVRSVAESAQQAGAEYILNARVTDIRIKAGHAEVTVRIDNSLKKFACRVLILSSGFGSPLLRLAGIGGGRDEYLVGCQVETSAPDLQEIEVYLGSAAANDSFAWLVPLSESRALVGMAPRRRINGQMDDLVARLLNEGKIGDIAGKPQTWGIPIRPISPSFADRVLVAGDAGGPCQADDGRRHLLCISVRAHCGGSGACRHWQRKMQRGRLAWL